MRRWIDEGVKLTAKDVRVDCGGALGKLARSDFQLVSKGDRRSRRVIDAPRLQHVSKGRPIFVFRRLKVRAENVEPLQETPAARLDRTFVENPDVYERVPNQGRHVRQPR